MKSKKDLRVIGVIGEAGFKYAGWYEADGRAFARFIDADGKAWLVPSTARTIDDLNAQKAFDANSIEIVAADDDGEEDAPVVQAQRQLF